MSRRANDNLVIRVQLLEERVAKTAGALIVLLESIDEGSEKTAAHEIREDLASDFGSDLP